MIRFLIELLIRRTWFGQSKLYFVLNWDASFGPNLRQTRSRQHDRKCRLKSSHVKSIYFLHPSQGNSTNYYLILGLLGRASHKSTNKQIPSEASEEPSDTVIHFYFYFFLIHRRALCSQPIRGNVRRIWRMFLELIERSFLDPKYRFVAVRRILPTRFTKQKFAQLGTN